MAIPVRQRLLCMVSDLFANMKTRDDFDAAPETFMDMAEYDLDGDTRNLLFGAGNHNRGLLACHLAVEVASWDVPTTTPPADQAQHETGRLITLVADLMRNKNNVVYYYQQNAHEVFERYCTKRDARAKMVARDLAAIAAIVHKEALDWNEQFVSTPLPSPNCDRNDDGQNLHLLWGEPQLAVRRIYPNNGKTGDAVSPVAVHGAGFRRTTEFHLVSQGGNSRVVTLDVHLVPGGTFRCATFEGTVDLRGVASGMYDVRGWNGRYQLYTHARFEVKP